MAFGTQPARGTRDILPDEAARRHSTLATIIETYQDFGFQLIETPAIERIELLTGGEGGDNEKQLFKIQKRGEELTRAVEAGDSLVDLGLRFDLTVPLTRYYGEHQAELPKPFKAIQVGPVWRAERPQKGRFRQFVQCDIDIIGDGTIAAEVDLIEASTTVFKALNIDVTVRINDRRLLTALGLRSGVAEERVADAMIVLDKLDKIGADGVRAELQQVGFAESVANAMMDSIELMAKSSDASVAWSHPTEDEQAAVDQLNTIMRAVGNNVSIAFDPTLVRGMGYYTGPIIEFGVADLSYSVGGGGRYDKLVGKWSGRDVPACGVSIGFERIIDMVDSRSTQGPVALLFEADDDIVAVLAEARRIRQNGQAVAMVTRAGKLGKQLGALATQNYCCYGVFNAEAPTALQEFQERTTTQS
jgi:histidyl-tRNA synthetase